MKTITYLLTLSLGLASVRAQSTILPGLTFSLDLAMMEQAKNAWMTDILSYISNLSLPDITTPDGKGSFKENSFTITALPEDVSFFADTVNNAIVLKTSKVSGVFKCGNFRYQELIFIATGSVEVEINTIAIQVGLKFGSQTLPDGRVVPFISAVDVITDIDRDDIKIHMSGNIWTDLVSLFEVFFKGPVADLIEFSIKTVFNKVIPDVANSILVKSDGFFPVPFVPNWTIDWETPLAAKVNSYDFELGVRGVMFDKLYPEDSQLPDVSVPILPTHDASRSEQFQVFLSAYSVDTAANSLLEVIDLAGWFNATEVPASSPLQLTTGALNIILPGISSYYGADQPMNVHFRVTKFGDFGILPKNSQMTGSVNMNLEFYVVTASGTEELAANLTLSGCEFSFSALVDNMNVTIQLNKLGVDDLTVNFDTFGRLSASAIKLELNSAFLIMIPALNHVLALHPVPLPTDILGLFTLTNANLVYYDQYIYMGFTPIFTA